MLGITGGGQTLNVTKKHFAEFLKIIVDVASLQTSYLTLDECLKITSRRVNALEYVVLPKIEKTLKYIESELDERSKEDKFKIKKVLNFKAKHKSSALANSEVKVSESLGDDFEEEIEDEEEGERLFK
jgi:V-type H+-transporting ATPase subunit D